MANKLSKIFSFSILTISILFIIILTPLNKLQAISVGDNGDNPLKIVIQPSENNKDLDNKETSVENKIDDFPDLGSEQVFPFEAGFGKNSGKS
tara:strand:+ start:311 stop:589 length:279 start_codon:yes stop_codon:yes gene_type:complete